MQTNEDRLSVTGLITGDISIMRRISDGEIKNLATIKNTVTNSSADLLAMSIAGDSRAAVSHVYAAYKNGIVNADDLSSIDATRTFEAKKYHTIPEGEIGWIRMPICVSPKLTMSPADSEIYTKNKVTFFATTASYTIPSDAALPIFGDTSNIFHIALVSSVDRYFYTEDLAFAVKSLSQPIPMIANQYVDIFWSLTFN